jgi:hypothetical protein
VLHGDADAVVDPRNGRMLASRIPSPRCGSFQGWDTRFAPSAVSTARVLPSLAIPGLLSATASPRRHPASGVDTGEWHGPVMLKHVRLILNVLWLIFGSGLLLAIGYGVAALICFALIVTIPFGVASLRLAGYALWPFGRTVRAGPAPVWRPASATSCGSCSPGGGWPWPTSRRVSHCA